MAAFVAVVISAALVAWAAVLYVWELAGWVFLLPMFVGLMLATWLFAPAWIADRRSCRAWLLAALAVGAPILAIGLLLPPVRVAQLPAGLRNEDGQWIEASSAITNQLDWYRHGDSPEARETAAMYLRAADMLRSWQKVDLLERWAKARIHEGTRRTGRRGTKRPSRTNL